MIINNKIESIEKINELNLNKFPEKLFKAGEEDKVRSFIDEYPAKFYAIRDKSKASGVFKLKVEKENIFEEIKEYKKFTINVSSFNYCDEQLLVGEIEVLSNGDVYLILSDKKGASVRDALANPTYNMKTNLFEKELDDVPYFDFIYNYIVQNELVDVIVEFALFSVDVGINNEKIIIYELRTNY